MNADESEALLFSAETEYIKINYVVVKTPCNHTMEGISDLLVIKIENDIRSTE